LGYHGAEGAARSVICAEDQGAFKSLHDHFFETSDWVSDTNWLAAARAAGVPDLTRFDDCMRSASTNGRIEKDRALAVRLRIRGTPTFVTKDRIIFGFVSDTALARLLSPHN
jgi:protein-disulfide isomerase